jgi:hypothetical protein
VTSQTRLAQSVVVEHGWPNGAPEGVLDGNVHAYTESGPAAASSQAPNPLVVQMARPQQRGLHVLDWQSPLEQLAPVVHAPWAATGP